MHRTVETLFRHARLVVAPLVLALVVAVAFGAVQPKTYQSMTDLWFDVPTTAAAPSSVNVGELTGVAAQEVAIVQELLGTQAFIGAVASRGPMDAYLQSHPGYQRGWAAFPGLAKVFGDAAKPLDVRASDALTKNVTVASTGPQVVTITVDGPTAAVAQGTAQAVLDEFTDEVLSTRRNEAQSAVQYQSAVVASAQQGVAKAQAQFTSYEGTHASATIGADSQLASLQTALDLATQRYQTEVVALDTATTNLAEIGQNAGFHVIDKPTPPGGPVGRTKQLLLSAGAGLIVGVILSGIVLFLLTALDRTVRRPEDVERMLELSVIGAVPLAIEPRRNLNGSRRRLLAVASHRDVA